MNVDLEEFFETCEIYSDSQDMNALLVVSDESEPYNPFTYYLTEAWARIRTDEYLIKEDPSLKTLWNFCPGKGLPEFQVDSPAAPGEPAAYHLSGSAPQHAAPRAGGHAPWRGDTVCNKP